MRARAVTFDVGNTLLFPYPSVSAVVREILQGAGHSRDLSAIDELMPLVDAYYEDRYREDDTFWTDEQETSEVWVGMYSMLNRRLGVEDDAEALAARVYDAFGEPERWRAYDDVAPAVERLRAGGLRVGIVSNWDSRLEALLDGLEMSAGLDTVISSAQVGLHKPDPRIFELACEHMGVSPAATVHVGDHYYADVLGATATGMTAVAIDRHGGLQAPEGVEVITTLDALDGIVGLEG